MLPILYLHGLSSGDFGPALGSARRGRLRASSSSIQRLTEQWQAEHAAFRTRELRFRRYAYLFVDGVNVSAISSSRRDRQHDDLHPPRQLSSTLTPRPTTTCAAPTESAIHPHVLRLANT